MELRAFLVEDSRNTRLLLEDLFASLGGLSLVGQAGTEAEAKLWLSEHAGEWDLAIVDLILAQGSGFEVLSCARQLPGRKRVVVFSGFTSPAVLAHCKALGADAVFDKALPEDFIRWLVAQRDAAA